MAAGPALPSRRLLTPEVTGILFTLLAMGCFGSMDAISKTLVQHYPSPLIIWLRHVAAVPLVLLFFSPRRPLSNLRSTKPLFQLARSALLVFEMMLVVLAFRTMALAELHAIMACVPLLVTALSVPLLGEQVGWRRWTAVAFGFLGVLIILRPGLTVVQPAALIVVFCAFGYAVYNIMTRWVSRFDPPNQSFVLQIVLGAAVLTFVGPFFWVTPSLAHAPLFVVIAALGATGHYLLVRALSLAPAVVIQPFTYTLLVWAVIIGFLAFGELPDLWTVLGALLIVSAGSYAAWREHQRTLAA